EVRTRIQEQREKGLRTGQPVKIAPTVVPPAGAPATPTTPPATPPATRPAGGGGAAADAPPAVPGWTVTQRTATGEIILESRGGSTLVLHAGPEGRPAAPAAPRPPGAAADAAARAAAAAAAAAHAAGTFAPNNIGLLIDDDGHV